MCTSQYDCAGMMRRAIRTARQVTGCPPFDSGELALGSGGCAQGHFSLAIGLLTYVYLDRDPAWSKFLPPVWVEDFSQVPSPQICVGAEPYLFRTHHISHACSRAQRLSNYQSGQ